MRFLLVRYSAIGDCVMAAPVASSVRRAAPDAFIGWAVEKRCEDVVDAEKLVDDRASYDPRLFRKAKNRLAGMRREWAYFIRLRTLRFDVGLDLQGHSKTALCLRLAKPTKRYAIRATDVFARSLNPILKITEGQHTVERNLEALRLATGLVTDPTPIMPELCAEKEEVRRMVGNGRPLATISVSAGAPFKEYPLERWSAVAAELMRQAYSVVFLGGPTDRAPIVHGTQDFVGKLSLAHSMAAVALSAVHLAADTGSGHMAAAYGVPVVSVFGPTEPSLYRPYTEKGIVLCNGDHMEDVSADEVVQAAITLRDRYGDKVSD